MDKEHLAIIAVLAIVGLVGIIGLSGNFQLGNNQATTEGNLGGDAIKVREGLTAQDNDPTIWFQTGMANIEGIQESSGGLQFNIKSQNGPWKKAVLNGYGDLEVPRHLEVGEDIEVDGWFRAEGEGRFAGTLKALGGLTVGGEFWNTFDPNQALNTPKTVCAIQLVGDESLLYQTDGSCGGTLKAEELTGTGNSYACINSEGEIYRSQTPCV